MSLASTRFRYTKNTDALDSRQRLLITGSLRAKRIWYERFATTSATASWHPREMAFSTIREAMSSIGSPQIHVTEADRRAAHARVKRLSRIGLAAEPRLEVEVLPHGVDSGPESRRRELDDGPSDGMFDLPVLDEVRLPPRVFRIVTLVVDVPFHEALHVHAEFHFLEHLVEGVVLRLDERVCHPDDRLDVVIDRPGGAVAPGAERRCRLPIMEELAHAAFLVEISPPRLHALVIGGVVRDCVLDGRIVDDVNELGPDPHPRAVRRDERLPGLACLASEDPVRFGRMAARLVGGDASDLRSGDEVHLPLRGLLALRQGPLHGASLFEHALAQVPHAHAFPSAGPAVVAVGLFDAATGHD